MRFRVRWRARPTNILHDDGKKLAMDGLQARRSARLIAMCHAYAWNSYKHVYSTVLYVVPKRQGLYENAADEGS